MVDARHEELERLVEAEYAQTDQFIRGVVATSATIRGWAITVVLAVLGFALERSSEELAFIALPLVGLFWLLDSYHAWLYRQALVRARALERITGTYYSLLSRGEDDEDASFDLQVELETHRFGLYSSFRRFRPRDLREARPRVFLIWFYTALAVLAIAAALLLVSGLVGDDDEGRAGPTTESIAPSRDRLGGGEAEPRSGERRPREAAEPRSR